MTPGAWHLRAVHRALDDAAGQRPADGQGQHRVGASGLAEQALAGAAAYKVHEDWGSTPAAIDAALRAADEFGLQVALHSDSLNEAGFLESTLAAIGGRSIHAFHAEGAGGGHAPDIIKVASHPHVIPGSTNPTLPHTVNTVAEHLDMLMVCHHLNPRVPEDLAFAESRIRATTIAAEDVLHDLGALSITSSDAQAMGRIGEVICRTWQVAHVMKARLGPLGGGLPADNERARRYVAKYTINPAVAHGIAHEVGSVEAGKLADLVLWDPRFFGIRPQAGHQGRGARVGRAGRPQRVDPDAPAGADAARRWWDADGADHAVTFVAPAALDDGLAVRLGLRRRLAAVTPTRDVGKADMVNNDALPAIDIDPETFAITVEGELVEPPPATTLPAGAALLDVLMTALALLLADARLPVAGHTQSGGPRARAGRRPRSTCRPYLALRGSRTVTRTEAATAVVTLAHLRRGEGLDAVYDALGRPHGQRRDARHLARPGPRAAAAGRRCLWDLPPAAGRRCPAADGARRDRARRPGCPRPSVAEVVGVRRRADRRCRPPSSCAPSTRPSPPAGSSAALPRAGGLVSQVAHLDHPTDIPATASPWIEQLAEDHAVTTRRLFRA